MCAREYYSLSANLLLFKANRSNQLTDYRKGNVSEGVDGRPPDGLLGYNSCRIVERSVDVRLNWWGTMKDDLL